VIDVAEGVEEVATEPERTRIDGQLVPAEVVELPVLPLQLLEPRHVEAGGRYGARRRGGLLSGREPGHSEPGQRGDGGDKRSATVQ